MEETPQVSHRPPPPRKLLQRATGICTGRACVRHRRDRNRMCCGEKKSHLCPRTVILLVASNFLPLKNKIKFKKLK